MELILGLLLGSFMVGSFLMPGHDDPDDGEPDPTEEDDVLTVNSDDTGLYDALGGADDIMVEAETGNAYEAVTPMELAWGTDSAEAPLTITGGDGDDSLLLSGSGYAVIGSDGADVIDLGDAHMIQVTANAGDTVIGGTGDDVHVTLTEDATYQGSDADEYVINQSSGLVDMGGGNDTVLGIDGGASSVMGGDGDDYLVGTVDRYSFSPGSEASLGDYVSTDADTLDGGAGNDVIEASHGDIVTTGTGEDSVGLSLVENPILTEATITDFEPGLDHLGIMFGSFSDFVPVEPLVGQIIVTEISGDTVISSSDGQTLAVLTGATGVTVGLDLKGDGSLTDLAGNPTPGASFDVVISRFFNE